MKKLRLVGKGTTAGKLIDLGPYPGAILGRRFRKTIPGFVFALPDDPKVLARLDRYEEFFPDAPEQSLFRRRQVDVTLEDATRTRCWIYEWNAPRAEAALAMNTISPSTQRLESPA